MADPYLGEIRMYSFSFNPRNYALCNGQEIAINQNPALYSLLGVTFGGNPSTTFNLPDLRSRIPFGTDLTQGVNQGNKGGFENVTLQLSQLPAHTHQFYAANKDGTAFFMDQDNDDILAVAAGTPNDPPLPAYGQPSSMISLAPQTSTSVGGSQAHNNIQPTLVINFCIALQGTYPSRN